MNETKTDVTIWVFLGITDEEYELLIQNIGMKCAFKDCTATQLAALKTDEPPSVLCRKHYAQFLRWRHHHLRNKRSIPSFPRLTSEQQQEFKRLYNIGYSAVLIFKQLGQDYHGDYVKAAPRFRNYRKRLQLEPRRPVMTQKTNPIIHVLQVQKNRKERIKNLRQMVSRWSRRITAWKEELQKLEEKEISTTTRARRLEG